MNKLCLQLKIYVRFNFKFLLLELRMLVTLKQSISVENAKIYFNRFKKAQTTVMTAVDFVRKMMSIEYL